MLDICQILLSISTSKKKVHLFLDGCKMVRKEHGECAVEMVCPSASVLVQRSLYPLYKIDSIPTELSELFLKGGDHVSPSQSFFFFLHQHVDSTWVTFQL